MENHGRSTARLWFVLLAAFAALILLSNSYSLINHPGGSAVQFQQASAPAGISSKTNATATVQPQTTQSTTVAPTTTTVPQVATPQPVTSNKGNSTTTQPSPVQPSAGPSVASGGPGTGILPSSITTNVTQPKNGIPTPSVINATVPGLGIQPGGPIYPVNLPKIINATPISSLPPGIAMNISASIGVPIAAISANIAAGVAFPLSNLRFGCLGCGPYANAPNSTIEGFVANGMIPPGLLRGIGPAKIAAANGMVGAIMVQNRSVLYRFIGNATPRGFRPLLNSSAVAMQNSTTSTAGWVAFGNVTSNNANISAFRRIALSNPGSNQIPLGQRPLLPYVAAYLNGTNIVNRSASQEMHIFESVRGNATLAMYIPTNVTEYGSAQGNATVIGMTNIVRNSTNFVNIPRPPEFIRNVSFRTSNNSTASAIAIKEYRANSTSLPPRFRRILMPPPGKVSCYIAINTTLNDSWISGVNYTFNVTHAWVMQNRINPQNLSMYRLNSTTNAWARLNTTMVSSNSTSYTYVARSPGMSVYAISGGYLYSQVQTSLSIPTTVPPQPQAPGSGSQTLIIAGAIIGIIIVLVLVIVSRILTGKPGGKADGGLPPDQPQQQF